MHNILEVECYVPLLYFSFFTYISASKSFFSVIIVNVLDKGQGPLKKSDYKKCNTLKVH